MDLGYYFNNNVLRDTLKLVDIVIEFSSSDAFKSTEIIKLSNKLLEQVLRKENNMD